MTVWTEPTAARRQQFWAKVDRSGGPAACWPWRGSLTPKGYGHVRFQKLYTNAHRIAWMLVNGPIATGLHVDHLCRNRACCNPTHLEPVTVRENLLRSPMGAGGRARRTHCPQGHEYTTENTTVSRKNQRHCKTCQSRPSV